MCFLYICIWTSEHQHSSRQEFIVVVPLVLLSDIMSKHVRLSAPAAPVCFPLLSQFRGEMLVKRFGVQLGSWPMFRALFRAGGCEFKMDLCLFFLAGEEE
ncbi:hypothetical protein XENOCAPTIV_028637 [Xenoophorus captivus]|uniref:Uncharacterized protein n=1 Tax=Xenoophorus captivus TaxID=1517983 RepID=A0ABV0RSK1_9TELE